MGLRNLTHWDDPIFRKKSKPVEKFGDRLWTLLDDMYETFTKVGGYGCAAVHVGVLRRAVVVNEENGVIELINPEVIDTSVELQEVLEGSIAPGAPRGKVIRPESVTVTGFDRNGNLITVKGDGFFAATLLHEIDHLDGILFIDKSKSEN